MWNESNHDVQYEIGMATDTDERAFNEALALRVRSIREARDWTAEEMAMALGIPAERYRKYENRSPIPQYLIPRVALLAGRSVEWVLTGKEPKRGGRREKGPP